MDSNKKRKSIPEPQPKEVNVVIFHKNCSDGFGAACAAYMFFRDNKLDNPTFIGLLHENEPPVDSLRGKNIAIFDFGFKKPVMIEILKNCNSLVLWDHHDTTEKDLGDISNCHFDASESGCTLAWKYFFPGKPIPLYLQYVKDADNWQWQLPDSRMISQGGFISLELMFEPWIEVIEDTTGEKIQTLKESGIQYDKVILKQTGKTKWAAEITVADIKSVILNTPFAISRMAEMCLQHHPTCGMAIIWETDHTKKHYKVHLRSREMDEIKVDVGALALANGGGGHVHASAFSLPAIDSIENLLAKLIVPAKKTS